MEDSSGWMTDFASTKKQASLGKRTFASVLASSLTVHIQLCRRIGDCISSLED